MVGGCHLRGNLSAQLYSHIFMTGESQTWVWIELRMVNFLSRLNSAPPAA